MGGPAKLSEEALHRPERPLRHAVLSHVVAAAMRQVASVDVLLVVVSDLIPLGVQAPADLVVQGVRDDREVLPVVGVARHQVPRHHQIGIVLNQGPTLVVVIRCHDREARPVSAIKGAAAEFHPTPSHDDGDVLMKD
jgi:hypothetical protein